MSSAVSAATLTVGVGKQYAFPSQAIAAAHDGDTIAIDAGTYANDYATISHNNLTLVGVGGKARLVQTTKANIPNGKGIWVVYGNNVTIDNIEFTGAHVKDKNGAGIRMQGGDITIRNSYFRDNQDGILGGENANVTVLNSEFAHNGDGSGQTHNIYVGTALSFTLRYSYSHDAVAGHLIKSRAQKNYIEYNRLTDETAGSPSYEIDLPNGGESYIIGNLIEKSTKSLNHSAMITYAEEGTSNPSQALYVVNNSAVNDSGYSTVAFVRAPGSPTGSIVNNIFAGPGIAVSGGSFTRSDNLVTYSDPGFVNKVDYDYRLKSTSAAIDAGTDPDVSSTGVILTPAYQYVHPLSSQVRSIAGTEIDQGAYEYGI